MKKLIKFLGLFIYKFTIIKKDRIVFKSFNGSYNDNPKYIFLEMEKINKKLDYCWIIDDIEKAKRDINNKAVKIIKFDSFKSYYYYGTAKVIIDNVHGINFTELNSKKKLDIVFYKIIKWLRKKDGQIIYSTWHGIPLKKMDKDVDNNYIIDNEFKNSEFLLGDQHTMNVIDNIHFNKVKCTLIGTPRDDILHCDFNEINHLKEKLKLPVNKKIVLYAPTFRSGTEEKNDLLRSGINQMNDIDFDYLFSKLNKVFGSEWVFIGRFHYHVSNKIDWTSLCKKYQNRIINGNLNDDMSEYLACTDILITDASSCMFDFMITKKPVFLFFPDYDYYKNVERGFYFNINELPFSLAVNFTELCENIEKFDQINYLKKVKCFEKKINIKIDKNSSKKISKYILKENSLL